MIKNLNITFEPHEQTKSNLKTAIELLGDTTWEEHHYTDKLQLLVYTGKGYYRGPADNDDNNTTITFQQLLQQYGTYSNKNLMKRDEPMNKYNHIKPIYYASPAEEREAVRLGVKYIPVLSPNNLIGVGVSFGSTLVPSDTNYEKALANSIPWSELRLQYITEPTTHKGGSSSYYNLPQSATELQDLIEHRNMNGSIKDIFKACYRLGEKDGMSDIDDVTKMVYYSLRELGRLRGTKNYIQLANEVIGDQSETTN